MNYLRNYDIFLDVENLSSADCSYIGRLEANCNVFFFVSRNKSKFDAKILQAFIDTRANISIIPVTIMGRNSMDFVITSYATKQAVMNPDHSIYIISGDQDFWHVCAFSRAENRSDMAEIIQNKTLKEFLIVESHELSKVVTIEDYQFLAK